MFFLREHLGKVPEKETGRESATNGPNGKRFAYSSMQEVPAKP